MIDAVWGAQTGSYMSLLTETGKELGGLQLRLREATKISSSPMMEGVLELLLIVSILASGLEFLYLEFRSLKSAPIRRFVNKHLIAVAFRVSCLEVNLEGKEDNTCQKKSATTVVNQRTI